MAPQHQLNLPPALVKRVADATEGDVNEVDMSLEQAKNIIGGVIEQALRCSGISAKEVADKAQVSRWCAGENPNVARLWQRPSVRRELVKALAKASGMARVTTRIEIDIEDDRRVG